MKIFTCTFSNGVTCRVEMPDVAPQTGTICDKEWSDYERRHEIYPEYVTWMNSVLQEMATKWGEPIGHCYFRNNGIEAWRFEPGKPPVKIDPPLF